MLLAGLSAFELLRGVAYIWGADLVLRKIILQPLSSYLFRGKDDGEATGRKFVNSSWKLIAYVFLVGKALWAIKDQQQWFWKPSEYLVPYTEGHIPIGIASLYQTEVAFYLYSLGRMFFEPDMKDFWAMFIHHLATLTLLASSWSLGTTKHGTAIMLLHDVADPFMELAKCCLYVGWEMAANVAFLLFSTVFIYLRDYVYPRHIIWNTYLQLTATNTPFRLPTVGCLVILWALHIFWSVLIVKIAVRSLVAGEQKGDIRERD